MGSCAVRDGNRTKASRVYEESGRDGRVLCIIEYYADAAMCYYSDIGVDGLGVCLDLILNLVERFEGGFATDGIEVSFFEEGILGINRACNGGQ